MIIALKSNLFVSDTNAIFQNWYVLLVWYVRRKSPLYFSLQETKDRIRQSIIVNKSSPKGIRCSLRSYPTITQNYLNFTEILTPSLSLQPLFWIVFKKGWLRGPWRQWDYDDNYVSYSYLNLRLSNVVRPDWANENCFHAVFALFNAHKVDSHKMWVA